MAREKTDLTSISWKNCSMMLVILVDWLEFGLYSEVRALGSRTGSHGTKKRWKMDKDCFTKPH